MTAAAGRLNLAAAEELPERAVRAAGQVGAEDRVAGAWDGDHRRVRQKREPALCAFDRSSQVVLALDDQRRHVGYRPGRWWQRALHLRPARAEVDLVRVIRGCVVERVELLERDLADRDLRLRQ